MKSLAQGRSRLKYHDIIGLVPFFLAEPRNRVPHHRKMRRCVLGEFLRTHERNLHPMLFTNLRYLIVVGGNYYPVEHAGLFRGLYRINNKRLIKMRFEPPRAVITPKIFITLEQFIAVFVSGLYPTAPLFHEYKLRDRKLP